MGTAHKQRVRAVEVIDEATAMVVYELVVAMVTAMVMVALQALRNEGYGEGARDTLLLVASQFVRKVRPIYPNTIVCESQKSLTNKTNNTKALPHVRQRVLFLA